MVRSPNPSCGWGRLEYFRCFVLNSRVPYLDYRTRRNTKGRTENNWRKTKNNQRRTKINQQRTYYNEEDDPAGWVVDGDRHSAKRQEKLVLRGRSYRRTKRTQRSKFCKHTYAGQSEYE
jgi:hypothetical protein